MKNIKVGKHAVPKPDIIDNQLEIKQKLRPNKLSSADKAMGKVNGKRAVYDEKQRMYIFVNITDKRTDKQIIEDRLIRCGIKAVEFNK